MSTTEAMEDTVSELIGSDVTTTQICLAAGGVLAIILIVIECVCACRRKKVGNEPILGIVPAKNRNCTDMLILAGFIGFWVASVVFLQQLVAEGGDPNKVIRGVDYYGRICGGSDDYSVDVKDKPYAAFPYPWDYNIKLCVADCSETETDSNMVLQLPSFKMLYYCIPDITGAADMMAAVESASDDAGESSTGMDVTSIASYTSSITAAIGDVFIALTLLYVTPAIAIFFSMLYVALCKWFAGCIVWTAIVGIIAGAAYGGYAIYAEAQVLKEVDETMAQYYEIGAYITWGITAIFMLVILALRKRIQIAIEVVKEASRAFMEMKSMLIFPLGPLIVAIGYLGAWIYFALYIFSMSNVTMIETPEDALYSYNTNPTIANPEVKYRNDIPAEYLQYEWNTAYQYTALFHVFAGLWNLQFLIFFTYFVLSGAVADWYFTPRNGSAAAADKYAVSGGQQAWTEEGGEGESESLQGKKKEGKPGVKDVRWPVCRSCARACRFHLGSILFGALIIAIINTLRVVVKYMEENSKMIKNEKIKKAIFCAIQCCLKCLECCLDKISKSSFIYTNVTGDPFLLAACEGFKIMWANLARVAAVSSVGSYILFIGKLLVSVLTSGVVVGVCMFVEPYASTLSGPVGPSVAAFLVAYIVSSLFMVVYDCAIDTIFMCFLIDEKLNKTAHMLASESLQNLIGKYEADSEKQAAVHKEGRKEEG